MSRGVTLRAADAADAPAILALISAQQDEGHLLPRTLPELTAHAARFLVAVRGPQVVGCAELAPLSGPVAEVRSLAVHGDARGADIGSRLVEELRTRAARAGFERLCAFTHAPSFFTALGFSIVPHEWVMDKVLTDCIRCPHFRGCGQYTMVAALQPTERDGRTAPTAHLPSAELHS